MLGFHFPHEEFTSYTLLLCKRFAGKNFKFLKKSRKFLITRGTSHEEEVPLVGKEGGAGGRGRVKISDVIPSFLKTIPS